MKNNKKKIPNPGSDKAIEMGCKCPVMDNNHGKGLGKDHFWISGECRLHSLKREKNK